MTNQFNIASNFSFKESGKQGIRQMVSNGILHLQATINSSVSKQPQTLTTTGISGASSRQACNHNGYTCTLIAKGIMIST